MLHAGNNQALWVTFTPTDTTDYTTVTQTTTINVTQATPTVSWATPAAITYGTALGSTQLDATSVPGSFAYTPAGGTMLDAGNNQALSVTFTPTDATDYTTVTQTATINVLKAMPAVSASDAGGTYNGNPFVATATVSGVSGGPVSSLEGISPSLTYSQNGATIAGAPSAVGTYTVTAAFAGSADYLSAASDPVPFAIAKATPSFTITSSLNPAGAGQSVTLTATVSAGTPSAAPPTGTVTFEDNGVPLTQAAVALGANGQATFTTSSLQAGNHAITVAYAGDGNYVAGNSGSLSVSIHPTVATVMSLHASVSSPTFGQSVVYTATVTAKGAHAAVPTGTVTFTDGGIVLGTALLGAKGTATFTAKGLSAGQQSVTASYGGDLNSAPVVSPALVQTVKKGVTTVKIVSQTNSSLVGQQVTFTATVRSTIAGAGGPTETVTFLDNGKPIPSGVVPLVHGQATFTTAFPTAGMCTITASYGGDANFDAASAKLTQKTVKKEATTVKIVSQTNPSAVGQQVTFTVTVSPTIAGSGTPTGTVTFLDNGKAMPGGAVSLVNGQATIATTFLTAGTYTVTASYAGYTNFDAASAKLTQKVVKSASAITTAKVPSLSSLGKPRPRNFALPNYSSAASLANDAALMAAMDERDLTDI